MIPDSRGHSNKKVARHKVTAIIVVALPVVVYHKHLDTQVPLKQTTELEWSEVDILTPSSIFFLPT